MNARVAIRQALIELLFAESSPELALDKLDILGDPWPELISQANENLVTAALWLALRQHGCVGRLTDDAKQYLESFYELNRERNASLEAELRKCVGLLGAHGIESMPLKGAAYLVAGMHGDPGTRFATDIDLLVPREAGARAWNLLRDAGYAPVGIAHSARHHHMTPLACADDVAIELHVAAVPSYVEGALPVQDVWREATRSEGGLACRMATPTDTAVISFLHSEIVDGIAFVFSPLRAYHDLHALSSSFPNIDWRRNLARAAKIGAANAFRRYLHTYERMSGKRLIPELERGALDSAHYLACTATTASPALMHWAMRAKRLARRLRRARESSAHDV